MGRALKTLIFDNEISLTVIDSTDIVNQAIDYFNLSPLSAAALGRTLTVGSFMATSLKNADEVFSITIKGDGIGGDIVVCGNSDLDIRGYIDNPHAELPLKSKGKLDVGGCVGKNGRITIVRNMHLKEPYTGSCKLVTGEIAEDFAAYYLYSEQQPTAMALGVKIGTTCRCVGAGGVIIQPLPDATEENIAKAEKLIGEFSAVSTMIEEIGLDGIIERYFKDYDFTEYAPKYKCLCSKDYIERLLLSFGEKELNDILEKEGKIEVICHFCDKRYLFSKDDVAELIKNSKDKKNS